ncbi:MAG: hypothetical protein ACYCYF_01905, partial [Anaerolineae bacterium]
VLASLLLVTVLVLGAVRVGSAVFADGPGGMMGRGAWGRGMFGGRGMMAWRAVEGIESLASAEAAFADYAEDLGYTGLTVAEVMEFEHNYYAIAVEEDTGIGAMELLIDKERGIVGPEYGPNMMWNVKYGMHAGPGMRGGRGMMGAWRGGFGGSDDGEMRLTPADAVELAQRWLDENQPGTEPGEADPFYGYYTLHFTRDGRVAGMLSVHGETGDVWYHSWHGELLGELEHGEEM